MKLASALPRLRADERKTRQLLFNLIGNAIKFTPSGGCIKIAAQFDHEIGLAITVADHGIGIVAEDLPLVLQPFGQIDSA